MRKYHFLGLGNAVVDRLYHVSADVLTRYNLQPGDFKKVPMDLPSLGTPTIQPGGSIGNICYGLGLLGNTKGKYLGTTGADALGDQARQSLASVNVDYLPGQPEYQTFAIDVLVTPDGQRTFVPFNKVLPFSEEVLNHIPDAEWLLLEGYLLFEQPDLFIKAAQTAKAAGTKIVLFLAAPSVAKIFAQQLSEIVRNGVDLLICNETEMHALLQGIKSLEKTTALSSMIHFTPRIITHGAGGATYMDDHNYLYAGIKSGVNVVDTTGAGDAFAAGFLDGFMRGQNIESSLHAGHALAHRVVEQTGARLPKN